MRENCKTLELGGGDVTVKVVPYSIIFHRASSDMFFSLPTAIERELMSLEYLIITNDLGIGGRITLKTWAL